MGGSNAGLSPNISVASGRDWDTLGEEGFVVRGRQLIAIAVTAVALNSCSRNHEQPMAPEPPLIVEFVADQPEFRGDENVMATLSNHSSVTVYFDYQCPAPPLEREVAGEWALEV